jgi:hypothetical protein
MAIIRRPFVLSFLFVDCLHLLFESDLLHQLFHTFLIEVLVLVPEENGMRCWGTNVMMFGIGSSGSGEEGWRRKGLRGVLKAHLGNN